LLTVLVPVISINEFFQVSIDSVKNQTFEGFVCHVLCGKLKEKELKYVNGLIADDERFILHQLNLDGIAFALNYGLNLVKTKYVARMDGDDICHPTRFEKQLNFLEENSNYVMVGCRVTLIDSSGEMINKKFKFFEGNREIRRALKYRMPLCHPAMIFRADTLFAHRGYLYGNHSEDHELYLRIARDPNNLFKNLSDNLFSYRRHENQLTDLSNAKRCYYDISGFLFSEFLSTWNPVYLFGMIVVNPHIRKVRHGMRKVRSMFNKF